MPTATDEVVIVPGAEVTFEASHECAGLTVQAGAALSSPSNFLLTVTGDVLNQGSIIGESAFLRVEGDVTNDGTWSMKLFIDGTGVRTLDAPGVTGDVWIVNDVILEGTNVLSKIDAFESGDGTMLIPAGATLRLTYPPEQGYSPAGLGFPDEEELQSLGTIEVVNIPAQINNVVVGSDLVATLEAADENTLTVETHSDEPHPSFPNSIEQWYRFDWSDGEASHPEFLALGLIFTGAQLNGADPANLYVYHSADGGQNWTQITTNPFEIFYDGTSGQGFTNLTSVPSAGDYVIAGPGGPQNAPPIAQDDREFTMQSQDVIIDVLANDFDPEGGDIQLFSVANGTMGSASIVDGRIVYSPAPGASGEDSFSYVITDDQGAEASAEVTLRIADSAIALFDQEVEGEQPGSGAEVVRQRTVSINFGHVENLMAGESGSLALNLFLDETVILDAAGTTSWSDTERSWMGGSTRFGDWITLEVESQSQVIFATAWSEGTPYRIERTPDNNYLVQELELSHLRDESSPLGTVEIPEDGSDVTVLQRWDGTNTQLGKGGGAAIPTEIDILVLFTTAARDASGSQLSMRQEIYNAINNTNQTYRNSGVNALVRLVGTAMVDYEEQDSSDLDLGNLTAAGQTGGSDVSTLRDQLAADIVGLVSSDLGVTSCGQANLMEAVSSDHAEEAFFVVQQGNCLGGNLSFAHEIGHIQGARHDWFVDDTDNSPFAYNHGYTNPLGPSPAADDQWRTVMAYNDACDCADEVTPCPDDDDRMTNGFFCSRLMWWSNPNNTWVGGNVMGIASGSNASDNVRTLNNTASTVAAFRGGSLPAVSGTIIDVSTGSGLANVTVRGISPGQGYETLSDSAGLYTLVVPPGTDLTVTPELDGYRFEPPEASFTNLSTNQVKDFTATPVFSVTGQVTTGGAAVSGVEIRGASGQPPVTDLNGEYQIELPWDWPGTLTPYNRAYDFTPPSVSFDTLRTDTTANFTASLKQHEISGTVETLSGEGIAGVTIEGLPGDPMTGPGGFYSVIVDHGWAGTAMPRKVGYSFEPFMYPYVGVSGDRDHDYDAYAGGLARSEWPMWASGPGHAGRVDIATFSNSPAWSATLEGQLSPPVVGQDGTVYAVTSSHLYAIAADGTKLWNLVLPNGGDTSPAVGTAGRIFVPSGGVVRAYDVSDQSTLWAFDSGERIQSPPSVDEEGNIYVGSNNDSLYAISPEGDRLWAFGTGGDIRTSPAISTAGDLYLGSDDGSVYAVDNDGNEIWSLATGGMVRSSPTIADDGTILVGTDADALIAIDPATGSEMWRFDADGGVRGTPALGTDGTIYFGTAAETFYALTPDGALDWSFDVAGAVNESAAVSYSKVRRLAASTSDEEVVYVSTDGNVTYAFNIRTPSGFSDRMRWLYPGTSTGPVLTESGLLVGNEQSISNLYALEPESRALTQISVLLNDFGGDFDPDRVAAILWLEQQGGPLALLPDFTGDPCTGGALVIPDCPLNGLFDGTNPMVVVEAGREILLGLAEFSEQLQDVIDGVSEEGLLATLPIDFTAGEISTLVVGGLLDPDNYASNPEGLSTELSVFESEVNRSSLEDPESVYVVAGNFSTDSPALTVSLNGEQQVEFNDLSYGTMSSVTALQEGVYNLELLGSGPGKAGQRLLSQSTIDLTGKAGEFVTVFARGFMDPEANNGGPAIGVEAKSGSGDIIAGGVPTEQTAEVPDQVRIDAVYPNPVGRRATVSLSVAESRHVRVELYDVLGRRVGTLVDDVRPAGTYEIPLDVSTLRSGLYVLRLDAGNQVVSRPLTIIR